MDSYTTDGKMGLTIWEYNYCNVDRLGSSFFWAAFFAYIGGFMRVAVVMGSLSDLPKLESMIEILKNYGVKTDVRCLSAHRAHGKLIEFIEEVNNNGTSVIIAAAGMAAALPGVIASQTVLPVIGVTHDGEDCCPQVVVQA